MNSKTPDSPLVFRSDFRYSDIEPKHPELYSALNLLFNYENFELLNPEGVEAILYLVKEAYNQNELDKIYNLLFNPQIASKEDVDRFRVGHEEIYSYAALELIETLRVPGSVLQLESGMYGGKSTLAEIITDLLVQEGYKSFTLVPDFMEEEIVTIRGKSGVNGKNHEIPAIQVGENWPEVLRMIENSANDNKVVVHFDEYSFMSAEMVDRILTDLVSRGYRVILAGLDTDFMGRKLEGFSIGEKFAQGNMYTCNSYVFEQTRARELGSPQGRMTTRHIKINNNWVIDLFAPVVIPKGRSYARYTPGRIIDHIQSLLSSNPLLLGKLINPDSEILEKQMKLYQILEDQEVLNISEA